ncbi:uncharacterized protein LOC107743944 [Sinocyclocheilus rhinocerous]|uniref:uncharacterized protein LOC107743944 n=1 Tax=Sinocyclocheilus rhinocerous TaxID=307959 RepID=UPI0007B8747C|nr:PREDICTED: uncharacterized protein LOC107743944 [Sinocyclocheilus rhinocerous]
MVGTNFIVLPGKPVILITINGRFDLHQPLYVCQTCQHQWTPDLKDHLRSGYWPASVTSSTLYTLDLLSSFQQLKVISPGFSRQAFAKLLEHRTKIGGRSRHINGDTLQRSFLEFSYASFEENQLCCDAPFTCSACTPEMLAVSADGNRKLYRFCRDTSSDDPAFFEGFFVAEDIAVSRFVETIQESNLFVTQVPHSKAASVLPALQDLTTMKHFLSVMHARAHATKCEIKWSGRNQEGSGTTAGEEVEQVNSYLSRCALTKHRLRDETARLAGLKTELLCIDEVVSQWLSDVKVWAAGETPDTSHASQGTTHRGLQQSIEGLYISVRQRKQTLYRQNDSSNLRHRLRRKLAEDKKNPSSGDRE